MGWGSGGECGKKCCAKGLQPIILKASTEGVVPRTAHPSNRGEGAAVILTGTYERNLDAKGRLSLPAAVRDAFSTHVYVLPAPDVDALYVFSSEEYETWVKSLFEKRGGFDARKREDQALMRKINSMATPMDIDTASRIGLSEPLREKKHLSREVTVVGNFDHLEIWDRAVWEQTQQDSDDDLADLFYS